MTDTPGEPEILDSPWHHDAPAAELPVGLCRQPSDGCVSSDRLAIAVIIPFDDPRGDPHFVKSWTRQQTCLPECFEVIVVTNGSFAKRDEQLRLHLRPQDRLIHTTASNRFGYYDPGARATSAPLLLITEDHCLADADCIEKALVFFAAHQEVDGAFLNAGHINCNTFARMEQRIYEAMFANYWSRPECWDKLRIRGTVVSRAAYFAAGGMIGDFYHFAETLLSARLHAGGFKMGYVPGAALRHVNTPTFGMMYGEIIRYAYGECRYRAGEPDVTLEKYLDVPTVWSQRHLRRPLAARRAAKTLRSLTRRCRRHGPNSAVKPLRREWLVRKLDSISWLKWREVINRCAIYAAQAKYRFWWFSEARRVRAVLEFWQWASHLGRLQACVQLAGPPRPITVTPGKEICIGEMSNTSLAGFHSAETWQGTPFRWSSGVAGIALRLAPGDYELCIDTAALRGPLCDFPFALMWNDTEIPAESVHVSDGRITCKLSALMFRSDGVQDLLIVSAPPPLCPGEPVDPRSLGMPIRAIAFAELRALRPSSAGERLARPHWSATPQATRVHAHQEP